LYRYASNDPVILTDSFGLKVTRTPLGTVRYWDQMVKAAVNAFNEAPKERKEVLELFVGQSVKFIDKIKKWKTKAGLRVNVFYVSGYNQELQFADRAGRKSKSNSINLFFGHGTGHRVRRGEDLIPYEDNINGISEALCGADGIFGFYCCWAGLYNEMVDGPNLMPRALITTKCIESEDIAKHFNAIFGKMNGLINKMLKKHNNRVELNLYFGEMSRTSIADIVSSLAGGGGSVIGKWKFAALKSLFRDGKTLLFSRW